MKKIERSARFGWFLMLKIDFEIQIKATFDNQIDRYSVKVK